MLTAEEIKNVIEKAEKKIEELQALLSTVEAEPGRVAKSERYWYISALGTACVTTDNEIEADDELYEYGNYYPTKEDAFRAEKQIRLFRLLDRFSRQNGWVDELWQDEHKGKWYIYCNYNIDTIKTMSVRNYRDICQVYFISESVAKQAIEKYRDLIMEVMQI